MSNKIARALAAFMMFVASATGLAETTAPETVPIQKETITVQRPDGSPIELLISRPADKVDLPILIFIDGSGCVSATRERFNQVVDLPEWLERSIATLVVEKPGVEPGAAWGSPCSETFLKYYSVDQRVMDHLKAIHYLRKHAGWWNRQIFVVGWSDGATMATYVVAYTPEVRRAVFGGMGGGIPMAKQFEDYMTCTPDRTDDREKCISDLRKIFNEIRRNPTSAKTWSGDDNSYKVWATRLDVLEYHLVKDLDIPFLIVHGEHDRDNVPVESARELIRMLEQHGDVDFEYWEVRDMDHSIGNLDLERSRRIRVAMLNWLFGRDPGPGGPPDFGLDAQQPIN